MIITSTEKATIAPNEYAPIIARNIPGDIEKCTAELCHEALEAKRLAVENRQLTREIQKLSELLSNVCHEIRSPLATIKGFSTALIQPDVSWDKKTQQDFLQTIDQETDRLNRLVGDLLDMSRLGAGALKLKEDYYKLSEILGSISHRLTKLTENHELRIIIPAELPPVYADEMRIGQILTNLIENSTKYSKMGGLITIEARLDGDRIIVSVTDQGDGIPAELLPRVFDRFYRVNNTSSHGKSGSGLGLSICRGIIEAHGGKIWAESWAGKGSRFSFSIPTGKNKSV